jgi:hypothetical protein
MAAAITPRTYTLYVFQFSLYSMMTRFTANLGAKTVPTGTGPRIELKLVNLLKQEQFTEDYLAINPTGQVFYLTLLRWLAMKKDINTHVPGSFADGI